MTALAEGSAGRPDRSLGGRSLLTLRSALSRPTTVIPLAFLVGLFAVACAAHWIAPYDPTAQDLGAVLQGPSAHHWLGTDTLGRDVLSRLIYGGRRSFLSIGEGVAVVLILGVPTGLVAGYFGGWLDTFLNRVAELLMSIPAIIFVLVILAAVPHNEDVAMLTFGVLGLPAILRVTRGSTLQVREELYITAARLSGVTHARILTRHVLRRIRGPLVVQTILFASYALLFEAGIAYLGVTGDPSTPTWGGMVAEAQTVLEQDNWLIVPSGVLIALTVLAFGLLGQAIQATMTPQDGERRRSPLPRTGRGTPVKAPQDVAARDTSGVVLVVEDLCVDIERDGTLLLDQVSFQIAEGETVGLVGESGCGKTLTALALLHLLPSGLRTCGGAVEIGGTNTIDLAERQFRRLRGGTIAYVSQEPLASLDPTFTVLSQLREVIRHHDRSSRAAASSRARELLRQVEIVDVERVAGSRPYELSGGMAQRVAIAMALAGRPRLLVADEPTTALDVTVQAEILGLIRRIQQDTGMAVLLITHNWGVVADICDRAIVMYAGQIVEYAPVEEVFEGPLHPYSVGLLHSHPSLATPGVPIAAMEGRVPAPGNWPRGCRFADRCPFAASACTAGDVGLETITQHRASRCLRVDDLFVTARR